MMHQTRLTKEQRNQAIRQLVSSLFKNADGKPYILTDSQCDIFWSATDINKKWVWISAPTRHGKTEVLAIALIYLARFHHLKIPVVGGSKDKAEKIMEYVIQHIGDHEVLSEGLININLSSHSSKEDRLDQLKIQMSKDALRWASGGWIYITSVDARNKRKGGEGVVGEGGDIVVLEEAGLIKEADQFSKIVRMPERNRGWGKLIMSGNCVERSVFEKAYKDPLYLKIRVDLETAVKEGRYTWEELNEKKSQTTAKDWKRYYLVQFPEHNESAYFKPKKYDILPSFDDMWIYGTLDPSLGDLADKSDDKKGSKIAIIVGGVSKKDYQKYEIDSIVDHITLDEATRRIFNMPYKFERFGIEAVMFQKYFMKEIKIQSEKLDKKIPFEGINQSKKKEERIESLEPTVNTGRILFKGENQLWQDMIDYPETEFLDGLDALEMFERISTKKKPSFAVGDDTF